MSFKVMVDKFGYRTKVFTIILLYNTAILCKNSGYLFIE